MDNNEDAEFAALVHDTVSSVAEFVEGFDILLATPGENYLIPQKSLFALRTLMDCNSMLTSQLFEENQTLHEAIDAVMHKYLQKQE